MAVKIMETKTGEVIKTSKQVKRDRTIRKVQKYISVFAVVMLMLMVSETFGSMVLKGWPCQSVTLSSTESWNTVPRFAMVVTYLESCTFAYEWVPCPMADCSGLVSVIIGSFSMISTPDFRSRPNMAAYFRIRSMPRFGAYSPAGSRASRCPTSAKKKLVAQSVRQSTSTTRPLTSCRLSQRSSSILVH